MTIATERPRVRDATRTLPTDAGPSGVLRLRVAVQGGDQLTRAGLRAVLGALTDVRVEHVDLEHAGDLARTDTVVVVLDAVTPRTLDAVRRLAARAGGRPVVVVGDVDAAPLLGRGGAVGVVRRRDVTPETLGVLLRAGRAVTGDRTPGAPVTGAPALAHGAVGEHPTPPDVTPLPTLTERERAVLRLLGEGADTREVARHLCYSERTVKVVVQDLTRRLGLRNRTHAVAYAVRRGLI